MRPYTKIIGTGQCLGPIVATNEDIGRFFPKPAGEAWTAAWVERRLGIRTRRSAFDFGAGRLVEDSYDEDMAYVAAREALETSGIAPDEIDRVIYASSTPEELMPDPACVLHGRLGLRLDASAIGLTAVGCGGFIYAMDLADSDIRSRKYRTVLIVGSVSVAPYIAAIAANSDPVERERHLRQNLVNAYIFGEGAGAMLLRRTDEPHGILEIYTGALHVENPVTFAAGGSRRPATHETVAAGLHRFDLDVARVKAHGPRLLAHAVEHVLKRSGIVLGAIDHFVFHQVNARILARLADSLGISPERLVIHVDRYGNLDTATLPVAFHEARRDGRIRKGQLVLFAAIGAGWQFGAAIVRA